MGCLILASIGLFIGLLLAWSGVVNTGNLVFGIVLMAICALPWVNWLMKKTREQEVQRRQEQGSPHSQPKPEYRFPSPRSRSRGGVFLPPPRP